MIRDCVLGTLIGFGGACLPFWQFDGPANFIVTGLSLSLIATYVVIGTNPVWEKKNARRGTSADGQEKAPVKRASMPSFYTIERDYTI